MEDNIPSLMVWQVGCGWMGFYIETPNSFYVRTPQALSYTRAFNATKEILDDYFAKLGAMYARLNILSKPMLVFSVDQLGVSIVHT